MKTVYGECRACCGCGACAHLCPAGAIRMEPDAEGFLYPVVDQSLCVDCGLCRERCPLMAADHYKQPAAPRFYAAKHRQGEVLRRSTSGGLFTALSDGVLAQGGAVYGAVFDEALRVVHRRADTAAGRDPMRFSKYVQSDLGGCFAQVEQDRRQGTPVLFTGTPCQNAGLRAALGALAQAPELVCCDVICHSIPSPRVWEAYKALLEQEQGAGLTMVSFRNKESGWTRSGSNKLFRYQTANMAAPAQDDRFYRLFFESGAIVRPACGSCPFTDCRRPSDITIADYWGIEKYSPEKYDPLGVSLVLVNSPKGAALLERCRPALWLEERPPREALAEQGRLHQPVQLPAHRAAFWRLLEQEGLAAAMKAVLQEE